MIIQLNSNDKIVHASIPNSEGNPEDIHFKGRRGISYQGFIEISNKIDSDITIKYNFFWLNPYISFYLMGKKIGYVKRKLFSLKKKYDLLLSDQHINLHSFILIYLLIFESEFDHD